MALKQIRKKINYLFQYSPFTSNSLFCAVAVWLCYKLLYKPVPKNITEDTDSFRILIMVMGKVAFWFLIAVISLSVLSTFITWLYFLWLRKAKNIQLQVSFTTESKNGRKQKLFLNAVIEGVRRPLLGYVKGRLFYDNEELTDKFSLLSDKQKENSVWRSAITGKNRLLLPDIKEYQLKGGFIFFEDMLRLFSLAVRQPLNGQFYQPPVLVNENDKEVYPRKTESLDVRIDQMRRVEGEYLNYKDFEAGDDVRRIVWKVYARNRELVVRMPERFEPYASHLYFYTSFEATLKSSWLGDDYMKEMLNYYKNNVWTVFDTLSKKEWEMRYIPDQKLTVPEDLPAAQKAARIISNSTWQQEVPLSRYFNARNGAVLCISSLTDIQELETVLSQCDTGTVVYFVKLSNTFRHFAAWGWFKRLLFLPPSDRLARVRSKWIFSPMRVQIRKQEKAIEAMLAQSGVVTGTL